MIDAAVDARGAEPAGARQTYIIVRVAGTTYAVPSGQVLHMEMIDHVTPVPTAPSCVEGVVFSRGHVVPVLNLRVRFGFERAAMDLRTRLLVVQHAARRIGLMVDDAREFIGIPDAVIQPPGETMAGVSRNYIQGVATLGDRIVLVLDIGALVETSPTATD